MAQYLEDFALGPLSLLQYHLVNSWLLLNPHTYLSNTLVSQFLDHLLLSQPCSFTHLNQLSLGLIFINIWKYSIISISVSTYFPSSLQSSNSNNPSPQRLFNSLISSFHLSPIVSSVPSLPSLNPIVNHHSHPLILNLLSLHHTCRFKPRPWLNPTLHLQWTVPGQQTHSCADSSPLVHDSQPQGDSLQPSFPVHSSLLYTAISGFYLSSNLYHLLPHPYSQLMISIPISLRKKKLSEGNFHQFWPSHLSTYLHVHIYPAFSPITMGELSVLLARPMCVLDVIPSHLLKDIAPANVPVSVFPASLGPFQSQTKRYILTKQKRTSTLLLPSAVTSFLFSFLAKLLERAFYAAVSPFFSHPPEHHQSDYWHSPRAALISSLLRSKPHIAKSKGQFLAFLWHTKNIWPNSSFSLFIYLASRAQYSPSFSLSCLVMPASSPLQPLSSKAQTPDPFSLLSIATFTYRWWIPNLHFSPELLN